MRILIAASAAALIVVSSPVLSQVATPGALHVGQTVRDASGARVGDIDEINPDGSVRVIYDTQFITLPAASLSVTDGAVKTSLTRKQINQL
jgi:hypothetical protein